MPLEIKVPSLGQSVPEATVGKWLKKVGDDVAADEAVVELETDKINMEVTAFRGGKLARIDKESGATVAVGETLGVIAGEGEEADVSAETRTEVEEADVSAETREPSEPQKPAAEAKPATPAQAKPTAEAKPPAAPAGKERVSAETPKAAETAAPRPAPRGEAVIPEDMKTSPAVRKLAREHRIDLTQVPGSGRDGRVTRDDVLAWLES
ncbi:MAG TPA: biotin/lipoyl-containing protein, partial [Gemmatimonadota bacterium]|nr:biotin/lipoyl-containing protein [Gemmatimonadota bacterium]